MAERGFALIELLVALALTALLLVLILGGLGSGRLALGRTEDALAQSNLDSVQGVIRNLLTESRSLTFVSASSSRQVVFDGAPNSIRFISSHTVQGQIAGLYETELDLVAERGGPSHLIIRQKPFWPVNDEARSTYRTETTTRLIEKVAGMRVRYFGQLDPLGPPEWTRSWNASVLPQIVEVSVAFPAADRRTWRTLVVPLMFGS